MGYLLLIFLIGAVWIKTNTLRDEIDVLRRRIATLDDQLRALLRGQPLPENKSVWERTREEAPSQPPVSSPFAETVHTPGIAEKTPDAPHKYPTPEEVRAAYESARSTLRNEEELRRQAAALDTDEKDDAPKPQKAAGSFEFQFGKRLPVWIGGIALALSGFYLVKYSIEQGWLTEQVRVILGFLLGCAMIGGGNHIRMKMPDMADGVRISQALTGAGVADLYATFYAATMMYHLMPPLLGLVLMAATTALAVALSVRHGMPIAVLGMMGGFLTPGLIRTDHPSAPNLFMYLFLLVGGLFFTFRRLGWWILSIPMMVLAFGWVLLWVFSGHFVAADDGIWLCLFILGVASLIFLPAMAGSADDIAETRSPADAHWVRTLHWLTAGAAVALMAFVTAQCDYGVTEWAFYGILALGGMAMSYFRPKEFHFLPLSTLALNLLMFVTWEHPVDGTYALVQACFAAVYGLPALLMLKSRPSLTHGALLAVTALGFYGVGYLTIHTEVYDLLGMEKGETLHFWSALAMVLAMGFASLTATVFARFEGDPRVRDNLLALFSLVTTAFISTALMIEVHKDFLPVAFAAEILAVCWVAAKIDIKALRKIAAILFGVFLLLVFPQLVLLGNLTANSLLGVTLTNDMPELAKHPTFQLGIPMVMLGVGAWLLRFRGDDRLVEFFEIAMVGLGALMLYYLARHAFKVPEDIVFRKAGFMERGVITNIFFAASLGVVCAGRQWSRRALLWSGSLLFGMALFRVGYFDLLIANPLWNSSQDVGNVPLFNWLVLPYALPVLWIWLEERPALRIVTIPRTVRYGMALLLAFVFISYNVRQLYHGAHLMQGATENAEVYTYSAVWLVLGALLLFFGTLKQSRPLRVASLGLMILTVGKVFLYDIDALNGLYRVFSFMGLGLSLLALSWFYTRFVFKDKKEDK